MDVIDDYHGTKVADPYRWLEDVDSPATKAWVEQENALTFGVLGQIPAREAIRARLTRLWNFPRYSLPFKEGGRYFFARNDGLQNQSVLYVQMPGAEPRVLLDPNALAPDGTVALAVTAVSPDGEWLAYGTATAGSDWNELRVRRVTTAEDTTELIKWVKFSEISWSKDSRGFFYSRYDEPAATPGGETFGELNFQKLYYHRLGTPQGEDRLIHEIPGQPKWFISGEVTDDGRYLIVGVGRGDANETLVRYVDLGDPKEPRIDAPVVKLIDAWEAEYTVIGNDGPVFYVQTNLGAPHKRIVAIDVRTPEKAAWKTIVPESADVIESSALVGGKLIVQTMHDASNRLLTYGRDGAALGEVKLPGIGTVAGFGGHADDPEMFYAFTSYTYPATVFRDNLSTGNVEVFHAPSVDFDPARYETRQVFYTSRDGTRVPMFITARKGLKLNGRNPTLLYGYGGFDISLTPSFSVTALVWMELGGVYAVANLRGGGEYGKAWHEAGTKERKQNVFDDFIAAADYLVKERYTSRAKLAINGGSNGGLLVGAVINQRPDLCAVAIPQVGVMDMLRYHKFTIGYAWAADYGTSDDPAAFKYLRAYSPLHNIKPGARYPAILITTADHDDRVVPGHSFKYAAAMQAAVKKSGKRPVLIRIESRAGHGMGKPMAKLIEESADKLAFMVKFLGVSPAGLKDVP